MSRTLRIVDGDLSLTGGRLDTVDGKSKLLQELSTWLVENFNSDRFHPKYGSVLDRFVGSVTSQDSLVQIESEVVRVVDNYQTLQLKRLRENPQRYSRSELLDIVDSIKVSSTYDTVTIVLNLTTADKSSASLDVRIDA